MIRREFLLSSTALTVSALMSKSAPEAEEKKLVDYVNPRTYQIEHRATLTNPDSQMASLDIWIPLPQSWPEQSINNIKSIPKATDVEDKTGAARIARLVRLFGLPGKGKSLTFSLNYQATSREIKTDSRLLMAQPYKAYRQDRTFLLFTRPETKIEIKQADIARQAKKIKGNRRPAMFIARDAYEWILDRTRYQLVDGIKGADYCLKQGHGECGDYSALFVALCRAAGVPARPVVGCWADKTNGWHVWAELMLPNGEWIPVDASQGDQSPRKKEYYFGNLDNNRVILAKSFDIRLKIKLPPKRESVDYLQSGVWWWSGRPGPQGPGISFQIKGQRAQG